VTVAVPPADVATEAASVEKPDYAAAVYGSLLVTTLVVVQWRADVVPELIGLTLLISVVSFWLAHAWSAIVAHRVHGPVDRRSVLAIAGAEASMLTAVIVPGLLLATPKFLGVPVDAAVGAALVASLVQLFLWGLVVGRAAHASPAMTLLIAIVDLGLGLAVVGLKVLVLH
jgi:hypothetical protein